ncbi:hypothetical protein LTS18_014663, partial [Coniosporium uncinatum]
MPDNDKAFYKSFKPSWGPANTLAHASSGDITQGSTLIESNQPVVSEHRDIRFAQFAPQPNLTPKSTELQQRDTSIAADSMGIPLATTKASFQFRDYIGLASSTNAAGKYEKQVWELASILFDDTTDELQDMGIAKAKHAEYEHRLRKDKLSEYWEKLVQDNAKAHIGAGASPEEDAFHCLSAHDIPSACAALLRGKDFRLATLVAQINSDNEFRKEINTQVEAWRSHNMLSEMTDPVRALYALLAGETCEVKGVESTGLESKASTFGISGRFNLDWQRAFGLRLWYRISAEEDIDAAVHDFLEDLEQAREFAVPKPHWAEEFDPNDASEDLLYGLLQLYTFRRSGGEIEADVGRILSPTSVSSNPMDARLCFQLIHLLFAK